MQIKILFTYYVGTYYTLSTYLHQIIKIKKTSGIIILDQVKEKCVKNSVLYNIHYIILYILKYTSNQIKIIEYL